MDAAFIEKVGPAAKRIVKEAKGCLYSVTGFSGELKGSKIQKIAQDRVDEVVRRQKRWDYESWNGIVTIDYQMIVSIEDYSVTVQPTPELYAIIHAYDKLQTQKHTEINDAKIVERNADPFFQWVDSLKVTGNEEMDYCIRKLKDGYGNEIQFAKFIWDNKPQ